MNYYVICILKKDVEWLLCTTSFLIKLIKYCKRIFSEKQVKFYQADTYKLFKYKPMLLNCSIMFEKLHILKKFKHYLLSPMILSICWENFFVVKSKS